MSSYDAVALALWIAPPLMQVAILIAMKYRNLWRETPCFFVFTGAQIIRAIVLWYTRRYSGGWTYIYSYWIAEVISTGLEFLVIYEVWVKAVREYSAIQFLGTKLFRWAAAVLICIGLVSAIGAQGTGIARFAAGVLVTERSVRIVQGGLLIFIFSFAWLLGLSWRDYLFGIALGFALTITLELAIVAVRVHGGITDDMPFLLLKPAAYNCGVLAWLLYFIQPAWKPKTIRLPLGTLADWNAALAGIAGK